MKILVVSMAGIGDTLFATPLIHELRLNHPDAQLDAVVLWKGSKQVLNGNPWLNTIHQCNLLQCSIPERFKFLLSLRRQKFELSINTHPQSRWEYRAVARFIGARLRASHYYHSHSLADRFFINRGIPQDYTVHAVENNLSLAQALGMKVHLREHDYELFLADSERQWAEEYCRQNNLCEEQCLGVHVGSGGTKNLALRRWPLENYIQLFKSLLRENSNRVILLFGGPEEEESHSRILAQFRSSQVLAPKAPDIRQAAALIRKCKAFLSVDTALMHIAAAVKVRRQFVIQTPTWNKTIEPYRNPFTLIINPVVGDKGLSLYRYDGRGIRGSAEQIKRMMNAVTVGQVLGYLRTAI